MPPARGYQQRLAAANAEVNVENSTLADYLQELWAFGLMPATQVQKIAALAVDDHDTSPGNLVSLANLGARGKFPSNCHRDLTAKLARYSFMPSPMPFELPMLNLKKKQLGDEATEIMETAMEAPHEVFAALFKSAPDVFAKKFLGVDSIGQAKYTLKAFWAKVPDSDPRKGDLREAWNARGGGSEELLWESAIPLSLHGDGVPIGKQVSFDVTSWSGLLARSQSTLDQKVLVGGLITKLVATDTASQYWEAVLWSLLALWMGQHPDKDYAGHDFAPDSTQRELQGKPLAGGMFGVIWTVKADGDWIANTLGLNHSSSRFPCPWCQANKFVTGDEAAGAQTHQPPVIATP